MSPIFADPPPFRHKPTRADAARANGLLSRGPTSEDGRRRSSMNGLVHGLRARRWAAVPALGEDAALVEAHLAAVRDELGSTGPVGRHLAETVAGAMLRAARADRLEGELLAGLGEGGRGVAAALHADRDARATFALLHRYRREADGDVRRTLDAVYRLHRARIEGLVPDGEEAMGVEQALDEQVAGLPAPSEPRIARIEPVQRVGRPANGNAAPRRPRPAAPAAPPPAFTPPCPPEPPPPPPEPPRVFTGADYLRQHRWFRTQAERDRYRRCLKPHRLAMMLAAEAEERRRAADGEVSPAPPTPPRTPG